MADPEYTQEQVDQMATKAVPLKATRVVRCTFGVDPKGNQRYEASYPGARAHNGRKYDYLTDLDFEKGDVACVETPQGYTLVTVQEIGPDLLYGSLPGHKWVIDKVDIAGHNQRKERAERRAFLMESLTQLAKERTKIKSIEENLADYPGAQELLRELKTLQ